MEKPWKIVPETVCEPWIVLIASFVFVVVAQDICHSQVLKKPSER